MLRTIHIAQYEGSLDEVINAAFDENDIDRENLISVEYATRVQDVITIDDCGNSITVQTWYSSALIIYDDGRVL